MYAASDIIYYVSRTHDHQTVAYQRVVQNDAQICAHAVRICMRFCPAMCALGSTSLGSRSPRAGQRRARWGEGVLCKPLSRTRRGHVDISTCSNALTRIQLQKPECLVSHLVYIMRMRERARNTRNSNHLVHIVSTCAKSLGYRDVACLPSGIYYMREYPISIDSCADCADTWHAWCSLV